MSKDIKKALEHCIEWNCADCPNREELGSGETVCRGRLLPEVLEYVADLEAKLAESEKNYKDARELSIEQFHSLKEIINSSQEEIDKLKQQLAEKDKEIERLNLEFETQEDWQEKWQKLYDETCNLTQDKISFAVEQLIKVKEYWSNHEDIYWYIDNQIKQLKEGK